MSFNIVAIVLSILLAYMLLLVFNLINNHTVAKSSGFKCIILPTHLTSIPWLISGALFRPLLDLLPEPVKDQWIP